jgi:3-keto-L-gulonate-6-phosphate decarboxylase
MNPDTGSVEEQAISTAAGKTVTVKAVAPMATIKLVLSIKKLMPVLGKEGYLSLGES